MSNAFFGASTNAEGVNQVYEVNTKPILVWPDIYSLNVRLSLCSAIHLGKPRSIKIVIASGRNDISHAKLNLRSCSAGLRLHTAEAEIAAENAAVTDSSQPGNLGLGRLDAGSTTSIGIPYGLESDLKDIKLKAEVIYIVGGQEYIYTCNGELNIQLPLSVNVQDSYQESALISNFTIGTASSIPARVGGYRIQSTETFQSPCRH